MEIDRGLVVGLAEEYQTATQLVAALVKLRPGAQVAIGELVRLSGVAHVRRSEVLKVMDTLVTFGVASLNGETCERLYSERALEDLQAALVGAQTYKSIADATIRLERPDIVLTRPRAPSRLDSAIEDDEGLRIHIEETSDAFSSLAASAQSALTIMTPFLDDAGAAWALSLFSLSSPAVKKHLILRFLSNPESDRYPTAYVTIRPQLRRMGVEVFDFAVPRTDSTDFFETFHAKVICADGNRAYVGSANLNRHSRETSMELGILVAGSVAQRVDALMAKIRQIAIRKAD